MILLHGKVVRFCLIVFLINSRFSNVKGGLSPSELEEGGLRPQATPPPPTLQHCLKGLKIANLNYVNSLLKHIEEICLLLSDTPFDILAINESKRDSSITDYEIHVHNYSIVRLDRNRCWGGVALYIENTLPPVS